MFGKNGEPVKPHHGTQDGPPKSPDFTLGFTPFDHTSVITTVQKCFSLQNHLTARDAVAPDLSCVLTRKTPRLDAPMVQPLAYDIPDTNNVNALHRVIEEELIKFRTFAYAGRKA